MHSRCCLFNPLEYTVTISWWRSRRKCLWESKIKCLENRKEIQCEKNIKCHSIYTRPKCIKLDLSVVGKLPKQWQKDSSKPVGFIYYILQLNTRFIAQYGKFIASFTSRKSWFYQLAYHLGVHFFIERFDESRSVNSQLPSIRSTWLRCIQG